jgi:hypothetical protein
MKHTSLILGTVLVLFGVGCQNASNPTINIKTNTTIKATEVAVAKFYDGKDGYSVSIPSGNSSVCTWTYAGGNAAVPYIETTSAKSATEKHTVYSYDSYDWRVSCVDDFGNQYVGVFPSE